MKENSLDKLEELLSFNSRNGRVIPQRVLISLLDIINAAWWVYEIDTGYDYLSKGWCETLGYEYGELENTVETWLTIIHPEDKDRAFEALEDHIENGTPYGLKARYLHKNGEYITLEDKGAVVHWDEEGEPSVVAGFQVRIDHE